MSSAFLSTSEEEAYTPVSAEDAFDAVRLGCPLRGVEIANLRELLETLDRDLPHRPLRLADCRVLAADMPGLRITRPIEFRSTVFARPANFACVLFERSAEFVGCAFRQDATFASTQFQLGIRFTGTVFAGNTSFQSAVFGRDADFERAKFDEPVPFDFAQFLGSANFHEARFGEAATFNMARFRGPARFAGAVFGGLANLQSASFESGSRLNLSNEHLKPGSQVVLTLQQIGRYQRPALHRPPPGRQGWLRRGLFRAGLHLSARMQHRWPSVCLIEGEDAEDPVQLLAAAEQYNLLRDNFRALPGREPEEDRCHYKYKDLLRRGRRDCTIWRFLDWSVCKWCLGYGIYTRRILVTCVAMLLAFAGPYAQVAGPQMIRGYDDHFSGLYFSAAAFTTLGYGDYCPLGWLRCLAAAEALLGLVLTVVFTVCLARKLIR